jgi:hypothetical protein
MTMLADASTQARLHAWIQTHAHQALPVYVCLVVTPAHYVGSSLQAAREVCTEQHTASITKRAIHGALTWCNDAIRGHHLKLTEECPDRVSTDRQRMHGSPLNQCVQ